MKVIDGGFGQMSDEEAEEKHSGLKILKLLEDSGVLENEDGEFMVIWDSGDSLMLLSNLDGAAEALLMTKKAEQSVMTYVMTGGMYSLDEGA